MKKHLPLLAAALTVGLSLVGANLGVAPAPASPTAPRVTTTVADWQSAPKSISASTHINNARTDGAWVFGDSILYYDGGALATDCFTANGKWLAVNAWSSRPTTPTVDALEAWIETYGVPETVVMAIGTNDIFAPAVMAEQIDRVMSLVPYTTEVVWVNVYATRWSGGYAQREVDLRNTGWVNNQIMNAEHKYQNLSVVRWYEALATNPGYRISNWLSDGVHTTDLGRAARNSMICNTTSAAGGW